MEAVITKSGRAVSKSNLSSFTFDIYGFLSSFKDFNQKQVIYVSEANFLKKSVEKPEAGYYYLDEYNLYMNNRNGYTIDKLIKNHTYKDFIDAEIDDLIQVEIFSTDFTTTDFYHYNEYNFKHLEKNRNYLLDGNSQRINPAYIGTSTPKTKLLHISAKSFFINHISFLNSVPIDQKKEYFEYVLRCALRINSINRDIFPILLSPINKSNSSTLEETSLIESLKNSLNSKWETEAVLAFNSTKLLDEIIEYYNILINFYIDCFNNQKHLKDSGYIVRLQYTINILNVNLLSTIHPLDKIRLLKLLSNGYNDKNINLEPARLSKAIVKISDSFEENQSEKIDVFLENLLSVNNSIEIAENGRNKITLFEHIYRKLKNNFFEELWQHSPLYHKINKTFNLTSHTSPLSAFVTKIYSLWTQSKYNPNRNNVYHPNCIGYRTQNSSNKTFTYTNKPATTIYSPYEGDTKKESISVDVYKAPLIINLKTFYINALDHDRDTIKTGFVDFDTVRVDTIDAENINITGNPSPTAGSQILNGSIFLPYGFYNMYQPIQVVRSNLNNVNQFSSFNHSWTNGSEEINQTYVPAFLFHYMQEKEDTDFIYTLVWVVLEAGFNAVAETSKLKKMIDTLLESIDKIFDIFENVITEDKYQIINDYSQQCAIDNNLHGFCELIDHLLFWLENYGTSNNQIAASQVKRAASNIVFFVEENGWPSDFDDEVGEARQLIINLAGEGNDCADVKKAVIEKVKKAKDYSINNDGFDESLPTNQPLFSDNDYDEICNYVSNLDLSDDFSFNSQKDIQIAFIFNAHRIEKQANVAGVINRIDYWVNLKKSIINGGRNKIPYVFANNLIQAQNGYNDFIQKMNKLFTRYSFLNFQDKRIGGSSLYKGGYDISKPKDRPGDLDIYLFINNENINKLVDEYSKTWQHYAKTVKKKKEIEEALYYGNLVKKKYHEKGFIYGYLIIKYDPVFRYHFKMNEDRFDEYFVSSIVNFSESKPGFDITIKDNSIDMNGTPPYIILNV